MTSAFSLMGLRTWHCLAPLCVPLPHPFSSGSSSGTSVGGPQDSLTSLTTSSQKAGSRNRQVNHGLRLGGATCCFCCSQLASAVWVGKQASCQGGPGVGGRCSGCGRAHELGHVAAASWESAICRVAFRKYFMFDLSILRKYAYMLFHQIQLSGI